MSGSERSPRPTVAEDLEDLDPGLARERTWLAWRRTAISLTAVSAAVLKARRPAVRLTASTIVLTALAALIVAL
ncbi:DUF202 domain-containing protein [Streptomyces sp. NPDC056817]|uniref:DUF202 domain-containing protein n=1 Tax=Streptomyces sp. NPDC056817 TaxID=3345950 RepID=UPI00368954B5